MVRDRPDIFSHFVDDDIRKAKDPFISKGMLTQDAQLIIIAGSDTTAGALTNTFYLPAKHPDKLRMLQKEIDPLFASGADFSYTLLSDLPYLGGVINESLRLHALAPSGLQRMTPREGVTIAGTYIPGDTVVTVPTHILHRGTSSIQNWSRCVVLLLTKGKDPRNFARSDEFIPERWSAMPELIHRKDAFHPFGIGKPLSFTR
jgi:cytochrome P450 family 628